MILERAATEYAENLAWAIVPLMPREKRPHGALVPNGWKDASTDPAVIAKWWRRVPDCNIGIACARSGLVVIDVDPSRDADEDLRRWECKLGSLPATVETVTGSGGRHLYFRDPGVTVVGKLDEIEVKSRHLVVAPPSIHPATGARYEWSVDGAPDDVPVATFPAQWLAVLTDTRPARVPRPPGHEVDDPLKEISARDYVPLLAGRPLGRDGKVACPFHEDSSPSLHCYPAPADGWYCFQCARGGSIYDFAGLLGGWTPPIRGADFLTVRDALYRIVGVS